MECIQRAQVRTAVAVNQELVLLYWSSGGEIARRQREGGWGSKIIDTLARDLKQSFPEMQDFSARNLKYRRVFAEAWPDEVIVQQLAARLPWFHNCVLLDKVKTWKSASGMPARRSSTAGAGTFSCGTSKARCTAAKERR